MTRTLVAFPEIHTRKQFPEIGAFANGMRGHFRKVRIFARAWTATMRRGWASATATR